jgi:hypothetical protein
MRGADEILREFLGIDESTPLPAHDQGEEAHFAGLVIIPSPALAPEISTESEPLFPKRSCRFDDINPFG